MADLPRLPRVLYILGLAGVGKSYVGDLIGRVSGCHVYHADDDLPAEMREAVDRNILWTEEQVDGFYALIARRILELLETHPKIVATQATYFQKHRDLIRAAVPDAEFLWVVAAHEVNVRRLRERSDYVSLDYFEGTRHFFETPPPPTKILVNDGDDADILRQLAAWYG